MKYALFAAAAAAALSCTVPEAQAHVVCGDRVFPATLVMDDPGVGDELSVPTVQFTGAPKAGGPETVTYGYEWDKTITEHFGFAINGDYFTQQGAGGPAQGWDNTTVTLKYQLPCAAADELTGSIGVVREFARTGASQLLHQGLIDNVGNTEPTLYLGKGLGDILPGYLRPFATTYELGYAISDSPSVSPDELDYNFSLQYSLPYLQEHVKELGLGPVFGHMVPLVEFSFQSPRGQPTTGTISPGILYEADTWQLGLEANIPANAATRQGQGVGFIAQFHLFLDDIFPDSLGKPLFGGNS